MIKTFVGFLFFTIFPSILCAQGASIYEEGIVMKTYMFSEPNPIPQIGRLYPYFRFDGYTNHGEDKVWKMVVLENEYIKLWVCPEIGGKVWGAIEKSTGKEFLYYNHVVKFRDVAMRGAWTSGGLEYNFGDIGHIPTCATPVDYRIRENDDGSVSCIVGALDLPSRTNWNVEIRLPKDKAYFETKATWFNNSELPVTYYHWMNAAAKADGNLEFIYPGSKRIGHGGELGDWPLDNGRQINFYEKNNFGVYKSYHVINAYSDYFGGYWHNDNFGFGHYSLYDDKPGKKIWIWGLSDQGMIWKDLLTDSDGQYVEYQSGKLFNQAASSSTYTPFKHREFMPYDSDVMTEYWFPVKETGGMVSASNYGVLNIERSENKITLFLSALQDIADDLVIKSEGKIILNKHIELKTLQLFSETLLVDNPNAIEINFGNKKLYYNASNPYNTVDRPVESTKDFNWNSAYGLYIQGLEQEKQRRYPEALDAYLESHKIEPGFLPTLNRLALSYYRTMHYDRALEYAKMALSIDTYDGMANYTFGLINAVLGHLNEAKSGFSMASQDVAYRSAAYTELAKVFIKGNNFEKAKAYLDKALHFNVFNIGALEMQAFIHRKEKNTEKALSKLEAIRRLDATNTFVDSELLFLHQKDEMQLKQHIANELPYETYLELALKYKALGRVDDAVAVLKLAPQKPMVLLWLSYLDDEDSKKHLQQALDQSVDLVFPHRVESVTVLKHFIGNNNHWKLKYYLALIYWNKGLVEEAKKLFDQCGEEPEAALFYLSKAQLYNEDEESKNQDAILRKAYAIDKNDWRVNLALINHNLTINEYSKAAKSAKAFLKLYPEKSQFGIQYAKALMGMDKFDECIAFLKSFTVLPYEGATIGRTLYHDACIKAAYAALRNKNYTKAISYAQQAKLWPKNLGVGKPYDVDERLDNFIIAYSLEKLQKEQQSKEVYMGIAEYETPSYLKESSKMYLQLTAMQRTGKSGEAENFLNKALHHDTDNKYVRWVEAKYRNKDAEKVEQEIMNSGIEVHAYDTQFVDGEFPLVLDLLKIIDF